MRKKYSETRWGKGAGRRGERLAQSSPHLGPAWGPGGLVGEFRNKQGQLREFEGPRLHARTRGGGFLWQKNDSWVSKT